MAVPPEIPTSFVPKTPVSASVRVPQSGTNVLMIIGVIFTIIALVGSGGIFLYSKYLDGMIENKSKEITEAKNSIDQTTVEDFIRLRNRFKASTGLLENHVAFSQFLDLLEKITLQNVRFNSLAYMKGDDGVHTIAMNGTARSFNALASESNSFAKEPYIRSAIFSDINVLPEGLVTFSFNARLDSRLIQMRTPSASDINASARTSTSTTATSTSQTASTTAPTPAPQGTTSAPLAPPPATTSSSATPLLQL